LKKDCRERDEGLNMDAEIVLLLLHLSKIGFDFTEPRYAGVEILG